MDLMWSRSELVDALRDLRRHAKGPARALLLFECHNQKCATKRVRMEIEESPSVIFHPPVKCGRCGVELLFVQGDPR